MKAANITYIYILKNGNFEFKPFRSIPDAIRSLIANPVLRHNGASVINNGKIVEWQVQNNQIYYKSHGNKILTARIK